MALKILSKWIRSVISPPTLLREALNIAWPTGKTSAAMLPCKTGPRAGPRTASERVMDFVSRLLPKLGFARLIAEAILLSLLAIFLLVVFIAVRRWYRGRYFRRLNGRTFALRAQWDGILSGSVPARSWRLKRLDCEIVESILLDNIEMANPQQLPALLACLGTRR